MALNLTNNNNNQISNPTDSSIYERDKNDTYHNDVDVIVKELSIDDCDQYSKSSCETCVFSADEQYFAWSSGFQIQLLHKDSYLNKNSSNAGLTINCGDLIRSLLFLKIKDVHENPNNFWPKSAKCKQLFLVTGHTNGKIRVWEKEEGKLLLQLNDHKSIVTDLATNADTNNLLISSSHDGTIKIRDLLNEGDLIQTLTLDGQQIESVQVSPNNEWLAASGSIGVIYIWKMNNYELVHKLIGHRHRVSSLSWASDNCRLASVSFDSTCMLWHVKTGKKIIQFNHLTPEPSYIFASGDNGYFCRSVCFSPDNHHLITVCDDNCNSKIRVWDLENNIEPIRTFKLMNAISCKYSPLTGAYFAVGTKDGNVLIMKTPKLVKSLVSLCRTVISKNNLYKEPPIDNNQRITLLPRELVTYLNYE